MQEVYRCVQSFVAPRYDGEPGDQIVATGTLVAADDPVVKGREIYFEPVDEAVERATARPGEKRHTKRAPKVKV